MKNNRKIVIVTLFLFAVVVASVLFLNKEEKADQESNVEKHFYFLNAFVYLTPS